MENLAQHTLIIQPWSYTNGQYVFYCGNFGSNLKSKCYDNRTPEAKSDDLKNNRHFFGCCYGCPLGTKGPRGHPKAWFIKDSILEEAQFLCMVNKPLPVYRAYRISARPRDNTLESYHNLVDPFDGNYDDLGVIIEIGDCWSLVKRTVKPEYSMYSQDLALINRALIEQILREIFSNPTMPVDSVLISHQLPLLSDLISYLNLNRTAFGQPSCCLDQIIMHVSDFFTQCFDEDVTDDYNQSYKLTIECHEGTQLFKEVDAFLERQQHYT